MSECIYPIEKICTTADTIVTTQNIIEVKGSKYIEKFKDKSENFIHSYIVMFLINFSKLKYTYIDINADKHTNNVDITSASIFLLPIMHRPEITAPNKGNKMIKTV